MYNAKMISFIFCIFLLMIFNTESLYAQVKKINNDSLKFDINKKESSDQKSKFPLIKNTENQNWVNSKAEEYKQQRAETDSLAKIKGIPIRETFEDGTVRILDRFENGIPVFTRIGFNSSRSISPKDSSKNKK